MAAMNDRPIDTLRLLADGAQRELFVASHVVLDDAVADVLGRARERGVSVRLHTEIADRSGDGLRIRTVGPDGQYTADDFARHDANLRRLAMRGVQIRSGPVFSHVKLWVADRCCAATGSANLTPPSLGTAAEPSREIMVSFEGETAKALAKVACWLWDAAVLRCEADPHAGFRVHQTGGGDAPPPRHPAVVVGIPGHGHAILDEIRAAIERARRHVLLVTMSGYRWGELPGLEAAVGSAIARGVRVTLARRSLPDGTEDCPSIVSMRCRGLQVLEVARLHAKGVMIDDSTALILTGNLNPFSLAGSRQTDHVELAVVDQTGTGCLSAVGSTLRDIVGIS